MDREEKKFLEAEERIQNILGTLKQLKEEAVSYKDASEQLESAKERVSRFVLSTERVAVEINEVVKSLKEIGGPEIFNQLNKIDNKLGSESKNIRELLGKTEKNIQEKVERQDKAIKKLKWIVIFSLSLIALGFLIGLIIIN